MANEYWGCLSIFLWLGPHPTVSLLTLLSCYLDKSRRVVPITGIVLSVEVYSPRRGSCLLRLPSLGAAGLRSPGQAGREAGGTIRQSTACPPCSPGRQATRLEGDFPELHLSLGERFPSVFKCGPCGQKTSVEGLVVSGYFFLHWYQFWRWPEHTVHI